MIEYDAAEELDAIWGRIESRSYGMSSDGPHE